MTKINHKTIHKSSSATQVYDQLVRAIRVFSYGPKLIRGIFNIYFPTVRASADWIIRAASQLWDREFGRPPAGGYSAPPASPPSHTTLDNPSPASHNFLPSNKCGPNTPHNKPWERFKCKYCARKDTAEYNWIAYRDGQRCPQCYTELQVPKWDLIICGNFRQKREYDPAECPDIPYPVIQTDAENLSRTIIYESDEMAEGPEIPHTYSEAGNDCGTYSPQENGE